SRPCCIDARFPADGPSKRIGRYPDSNALIHRWQIDLELRSLARTAAHADRAAVVADDAIADRQSESGPLLLRREERVEEPAHRRLVHSLAVVADRDLDIRAVLARDDVDAPASRAFELGDRIQRVLHDVQHDLLDLLHVD